MTKDIFSFLGTRISKEIEKTLANFENISEIRLRADKPLIVKKNGREVFTGGAGAFCPTAEDIRETMERISQYSFYAFEAELSLGYITLPGGHRVGVSGQAAVENGAVRAWRHISGLNIRVARGVYGYADAVLPYLFEEKKFFAHNDNFAARLRKNNIASRHSAPNFRRRNNRGARG